MAEPYRSGDPQWEYNALAVPLTFGGAVKTDAFVTELNRLGAEGWELVAVTVVNGACATLKRRRT